MKMIIKNIKHHLIIFQKYMNNLIQRLIQEEKKLNSVVIYQQCLLEIKLKAIHT